MHMHITKAGKYGIFGGMEKTLRFLGEKGGMRNTDRGSCLGYGIRVLLHLLFHVFSPMIFLVC
jgi:hypothetical protein